MEVYSLFLSYKILFSYQSSVAALQTTPSLHGLKERFSCSQVCGFAVWAGLGGDGLILLPVVWAGDTQLELGDP